MSKYLRNYRENKLPLRYKLFTAGFFTLIVVVALMVFFNYDYFVFKILMTFGYSYTDTLNGIYESELEMKKPNLYMGFDDFVIAAVTEKIRNTNNDRYTYLYTPPLLALQNEYTKTDALEAEIKDLGGGVGYLRIPNVSTYTEQFVYDNKAKLGEFTDLVVDLRQNYGGELNSLYKIVDLFLPKGAIIGYETTRFADKAIKAGAKQTLTYNHIVCLQNENTASAAEGFINALRENLDNVTVMGTTSFGKGIGQITIPLKSGYAVKATVLQIKTPQGNTIHRIGIKPDVEFEGEGIIDHALEYIKTNG